MLHRCSIYVFVFAISIAYYKLHKPKPENLDLEKDFIRLAIGILSARENFEQRQSIRDTWLNSESLSHWDVNAFKPWFVIGNRFCDVPPQCRRNKYDCEKWDVHFSDVLENFYTSKAIFPNNSTNNVNVFHQGFTFQVNHPVVVTKLGILSELLPHFQEVSILLLDLQTKAVVVNTTLSKISSSINHDGFAYQEVENFILPKHYEGLVLVEGPLLHHSSSNIQWSNNSGVITFTRIFVTADDIESVAFSEELTAAPSIGFLVHGMDDLNEMSLVCGRVFSDWENYCAKINDKLLKEHKKYGDILFVDVLDIYRNLPKKLLHFYKWLATHHNFSYLLKTDDDCVIDIKTILQQLQNTQKFNPNDFWIWSRFRSHWPVNYIGKWSDYEYKSPIYPSFPCGGAYVLSQQIVRWLERNFDNLFSYQGEDVSLGIWLSAINPQYIEDRRWECDEVCTKSSYNRAQLTPQNIIDVWLIKEKCGNICSCN